jgi:hypothetical protein
MKLHNRLLGTFALGLLATGRQSSAATFGDEVAFLKQHTEVVVLHDKAKKAELVVAPAWQGRVMTSTADGEEGASYGWVNRGPIASGILQPHMNVFGGEDRFWIGPEGGQFGLFFAKGAPFDLPHWFTPAPIDTLPYSITRQTKTQVDFEARFSLTNYSGTTFEVKVDRQVRLLTSRQAWHELHLEPLDGGNLVAYQSVNKISNAGSSPWTKETGLLSIWILGQFNPSPGTTIVVPIKAGPESELGPKLTSNYFGEVPTDRLVVKDDVVYFCADGRYRSKIGINPKRSKAVLGSYDADHRVLTIVQFSLPEDATEYVNSLWTIQPHPYAGDAENSYNDGPPSPGAKPLGPFYEMESSSPAAALAPGASRERTHRTIHLSGSRDSLDAVARSVLGVSLAQIESALAKH